MIWIARIASAGVERTHRDDERPLEHAARSTRAIRAIHGDVDAQLDVAERNAGAEQGGLERERAADEKTDEVVAPQPADVGRFVGQLAVSPDAIARQVGSQVGHPRDVRGNRIPRLGHVEQRAGLRIAAAELMEVVRPFEREDDQVRLRETGGQPGGLPGETTIAAGFANETPGGECGAFEHAVTIHDSRGVTAARGRGK